MIHSLNNQNIKSTNDTRTLHIAIVSIITVLILAQGMLIYVILSQKPDAPILARPAACDNFELNAPDERVRATSAHIVAILFLDWRDRSVVKRLQRDTGIGQNRFDIEYPPFGNLKGQMNLHHYHREVSLTYLDMLFQTSLDLVTNSFRQNDTI